MDPAPRIGDKKGGFLDNDYSFTDVQVHHPQFLEWVGTPESARLHGRAPGEWIQSLTRVLTLDAERQLQCDTCLMTSNLSILDQYAASDMLELVVGCYDFPSAAMTAASPVPSVRRASTHMEAMGIWRPPHGPSGPSLDFFHQGPMCTGCPSCVM